MDLSSLGRWLLGAAHFGGTSSQKTTSGKEALTYFGDTVGILVRLMSFFRTDSYTHEEGGVKRCEKSFW